MSVNDRRLLTSVIGALAGLATVGGDARAEGPPPPMKVFGIQVAPGFKRLPNDPVAGLMFGNNAGSPQTFELGLNVNLIFLPHGWPVSLTLGGLYTSSNQRVEGHQETASTFELGLGVRKTFDGERLHEFIGVGLALGSATIKDDFPDNGYETTNGAGSGGFVEAGGFVRLRGMFDLGLAARYSTFPSRWLPVVPPQYWNAGGLFAGLIIGYAH